MPTNIQYAFMAGASYISNRPDKNAFPIQMRPEKGSSLCLAHVRKENWISNLPRIRRTTSWVMTSI
jgi:hypothetical protein